MLRLEGSRQLESCTSYEGYRSTPAYVERYDGRVIDERLPLVVPCFMQRVSYEHVEDRKMLDDFGRERPTFVSAEGRHPTRFVQRNEIFRNFEGCESASCPIRRFPWYFRTCFAPYRSIRGINRRSREETSREHRVLPI